MTQTLSRTVNDQQIVYSGISWSKFQHLVIEVVFTSGGLNKLA
ncbi:hypothetical protein QGP82_20165 [Leptothoe sp. LEGE 181152]|nr:hypothetical protein [Leptothoe sp. LEGE 181152]